ncbi:hypothetical protein RN001_007754 [Aquatica leii]|uniref:THAP-type domain-containing protein n=1 Tax=Aquatica leii TaxID=1421715 RepID=A0AAN7P9X7_9COLE|nr:hypothetical protein RN001_007754 [Aquatica leii]
MVFCLVVKCGSTSLRDKSIHFYRVPSIYNRKGKLNDTLQRRRNQWISLLKREDLTENKINSGRICSKHFITGQPAKWSDIDNPDWLPTQNMGYNSINQPAVSAQERFERAKRRKIKDPLKKSLSANTAMVSNIRKYFVFYLLNSFNNCTF